jgi:uncharacterized protein (DUF1800 family)
MYRNFRDSSARGLVLLVLPLLFVLGFASNASAALTGSFAGPGADVVSPGTLSPDGQPDFDIKVTGLRSVPTQIQILSDTNGVWASPFNGSNWLIGLLNYNNGAADLYFSQFPSNGFTLQVLYSDGSSDQATVTMPPPPQSTLKATFAGSGPDVVSPGSLSPDGRPDFDIKVTGLRSMPTQIRIHSDTNGLWESPFNGTNWIIGLPNYSNGAGDLYFSQFPSNTFTLEVRYADGTGDQAAVSAPPSTLTAAFAGVGSDVVSPASLSPDGQPDFDIKVSGLRSIPAQIRILSDSNGVWETPFNGANWIIGLPNYSNGAGDLYFSQFPSSNFTLQVRYADGSSDQTTVAMPPPPPSTLAASLIGIGYDRVSEITLSPDGRPDFNIRLTGLRSVPTQVQITSDTSGIWVSPFNGGNWTIGMSAVGGGSADLYFSQYASNTFRVHVVYADGSSDQANALARSPELLADAQRLLEQATFGPKPTLTASVQSGGIESFLDQQLYAPMQDYPDLPFWPQTRPTTCIDDCQRDNYSYYPIQRHLFANALSGQDQLRQRVAFGLSQILVTSETDVPLPAWMRSYQQLLYRGALGNFRQLLFDATLHPTMGRFLDMLNNRCQKGTPVNANICRNGLTSQPNENYSREVLQLFSIGTYLLNPDGTRKLDAGNNPIPSYDQKTVEEFARVFTGWILAPALAAPAESGATTVPNYRDPMVQHLDSSSREDYHDRGDKALLNGTHLTAGRTALQDLNDAIDNIAYHPNVAPFISKQLIQQLVESNPSPAYVARISAVWTANRFSNTQLFEVVKAILLDPEARGDNRDPLTAPNYGKLREPVLFMTNILRSLNATSDGVLNSPGGGIGTADMSEDLFNAPSVFNYFPPGARVPAENAAGPEFAIFSSLTALRRDNFVNQVVFSTIAPSPPNRPVGTSIDLTPFNPLAANPDQLLDALNNLMLHASMSAAMRQSIKGAVSAISATNSISRVRTAVYLIATSSQYQVQR